MIAYDIKRFGYGDDMWGCRIWEQVITVLIWERLMEITFVLIQGCDCGNEAVRQGQHESANGEDITTVAMMGVTMIWWGRQRVGISE